MHRNAIYVLLLTVAGLTALGIVMLFSTGAFAPESQGDIYYFVKRQGMWLGVAVLGAITAACINYDIWRRTWWLFFIVAFILLLLCFVPGIGMKINGSSRWINLRVATFQPSELAKIAALFFLAWWFTRFEKKTETFLFGLFLPLAILGILVVPILLEVDLGASALIMGTGIAVMFLAGASLRWLGLFAVIGLVGILYGATHIDERLGRLLAFMYPDKYPDEFYQQMQGLIAIGSGGIDGLGLGAGRQKLMYLPYAHTDFIFPMVAEELGLKFSLATVFGYLLICLCGTMVAANARDRFGMLLGFGCVMIISLQAVVNIGVTTALLPNKGMPLPFVSFGGSNLAVCYFMIGILINIHRHGIPLVERVSPVLRRVRNSCRL
jgi:cell division protein FtsW